MTQLNDSAPLTTLQVRFAENPWDMDILDEDGGKLLNVQKFEIVADAEHPLIAIVTEIVRDADGNVQRTKDFEPQTQTYRACIKVLPSHTSERSALGLASTALTEAKADHRGVWESDLMENVIKAVREALDGSGEKQ